jgi:hypothetical protein
VDFSCFSDAHSGSFRLRSRIPYIVPWNSPTSICGIFLSIHNRELHVKHLFKGISGGVIIFRWGIPYWVPSYALWPTTPVR